MHPAQLDEPRLLAECQVRRQRRSGPGGQHRNKVETAVVITHLPTGVRAEASERRSQEENRLRAVRRLRLNLAMQVRRTCDNPEGYIPSELWSRRLRGARLAISPDHSDFPALLAEALDVLTALGFEAKPTAAALGCSPSQLIRFLQCEPRALALVNEQRRARGKSAYH